MRKAFTVVELIVVLTVILVLVGIAVPRMKGYQDEANKAKANAELNVLKAAVESYSVNNSALPADIHATLTGATPRLLTAALSDPFRSGEHYGFYTNGNYYVIASAGAGGVLGINGINASGEVQGKEADDLCVTNGSGC